MGATGPPRLPLIPAKPSGGAQRVRDRLIEVSPAQGLDPLRPGSDEVAGAGAGRRACPPRRAAGYALPALARLG